MLAATIKVGAQPGAHSTADHDGMQLNQELATSHLDTIVQMPTPINATPAINFSVDVGTKRVTNEPNNTASSVDTTSALEAAIKTEKGRTDLSVAYSIVAI